MEERKCEACGTTSDQIILYKYETPYCWRHYLQMVRFGSIKSHTKYDPNDIIDCDGHAEIVLRGKFGEEVARALIDKRDIPKARKYKWSLMGKHRNKKYAATSTDEKTTLHCVLMGRRRGKEIDHINGNGLDCRRSNLRHVTHYGNILNRHARLNKHGRMGISWRDNRKKWVATIIVRGKSRHRHFSTKAEAISQREEWERQVLNGVV